MLLYVKDQTQALRTNSPGVINNDAESVHDLRLATRRLRSALASARKLFDRNEVSNLRDELKWLGGVLGEARDSQVIHERLVDAISNEPPGADKDAIAERTEAWYKRKYSAAHSAAAKALGSQRFRDLLASLDSFAAAPPAPSDAVAADDKRAAKKLAKAAKPVKKGFAKLAAREAARVRKTVKAVPTSNGPAGRSDPDNSSRDNSEPNNSAPDNSAPQNSARNSAGTNSAGQNSTRNARDDRDRGLHEVRKAAKRLRYVAEAAIPHVGKPAKRVERRAHNIQKMLGVHQDAVVVGSLLKDVGMNSLRSGESAFIYGRLHAREEATARESDREFRKFWKGLKKKHLKI